MITTLLGNNEYGNPTKAKISRGGYLGVYQEERFAVVLDEAIIATDFKDTVTDTEARQYLLHPSTDYDIHILDLTVGTDAGAVYRLYELETTDVTDNGTAITHFRLNRSSTVGDTERIFCYHTPTLADTGVLKYIAHNGGSTAATPSQGNSGGVTDAGGQILIDKHNTKSYLMDIRPEANSEISFLCEYHEHNWDV